MLLIFSPVSSHVRSRPAAATGSGDPEAGEAADQGLAHLWTTGCQPGQATCGRALRGGMILLSRREAGDDARLVEQAAALDLDVCVECAALVSFTAPRRPRPTG
jgi:hypothetical protein